MDGSQHQRSYYFVCINKTNKTALSTVDKMCVRVRVCVADTKRATKVWGGFLII